MPHRVRRVRGLNRLADLRRGDRALALVVLITALAAALRFATLDVQSVWLDEAITMRVVSRGLGAMLSQLPGYETTPPLYYLLVWAWTHVAGHGVVAFRAFSALFGTLTIPLLYVAGRRYSAAAGLWAAGLGAISAEMFYYSQEARPYALFIFLSVAAFVAWQQALEAPRARTLALWTVLSILALLAHYFAAFLFAGELLVLARRLDWRRLAAPAGAYALAAGAVAPLAVAQATSGQADWIANLSLASRVAQTSKEFLIGSYAPLGIVLAPVAGLLVALLLVRLVRNHDVRQREALLEVATVGVLAIGLPVLLALTHIQNVFDARNVTGAWPVLAVLAAAALATGPGLRFGAWVGSGLIVLSAGVIIGTLAFPAYQRDDWRGAARSLPAPAAGGRVLVSERYGTTPLSVYLSGVRTVPDSQRAVSTRELDFVFLRRVHGGAWAPSEDSLFAPLAPGAPAADPPAPFRLIAVRRSEAYATYRFLAPAAGPVTIESLRRAFGDRNASFGLQGRREGSGAAR